MQDTQITNYVMDLMRDKNGKIRAEANEVLNIMEQYDDRRTVDSLKDRIRQLRFELHNNEWCKEHHREIDADHFDYDYESKNSDGLGGTHDSDEFVFQWEDAAEDLSGRDWWKKEFVD